MISHLEVHRCFKLNTDYESRGSHTLNSYKSYSEFPVRDETAKKVINSSVAPLAAALEREKPTGDAHRES